MQNTTGTFFSTHLPIYPLYSNTKHNFFLFVYMYLLVFLFVCLFIFVFIYYVLCASIYMHTFIFLAIYLFIYLFIYQSFRQNLPLFIFPHSPGLASPSLIMKYTPCHFLVEGGHAPPPPPPLTSVCFSIPYNEIHPLPFSCGRRPYPPPPSPGLASPSLIMKYTHCYFLVEGDHTPPPTHLG